MATEIGPDAVRGSTQDAYRTRNDSGARTGAQRMADAGRAEAKAMWDDTKANVRSALNEKQSSTASDIGDLAGALRNAARSINQQSPAARMAGHAADSLERLSGTLRHNDFESLLHEVQTFARNQPAVFLGMAVAAGFLATRFLKSSAPHPHIDRPDEAPPLATSGRPDGSTSMAGADDESTFPYDPRRT